jgi:DNA-binding MarR family transcriptional regulator
MSSAKTTHETDVAEFALAIGLLLRRIRSAAPSELSELSWTQKSVIKRLERDGPATTSELARAEGVKPQSMGTAVATLEEMGLVERKAHPTDGRQINIVLTTKGKIIRKDTQAAKHTWFAQAVEQLDKRDQATLFKASRIIKQLVEL